jgi:hypothetical protein
MNRKVTPKLSTKCRQLGEAISYNDDESNSDDINQQRINLAKTIRLISIEQDVSCNEWIEQWINRISIDHVSSGESLLT